MGAQLTPSKVTLTPRTLVESLHEMGPMTNLPPTSRVAARAAAVRVTPVLRPVAAADFFSWVSLLAEALEESNRSYRDEIALRIWQQLGLAPGAETAASGLEAVVADRSGNLVGLALTTPSLSLASGSAALDVHLAYVHRVGRDEVAATALIDELNRRARAIGATKLRWFATSALLRDFAGAEPATSEGLFESDVPLEGTD